MTKSNNYKIETLEELSQKKAKRLLDISGQKEQIYKKVQIFTNPLSRNSQKSTNLMRSFGLGMFLVDNILFGLKFYRKIKRIFKRY